MTSGTTRARIARAASIAVIGGVTVFGVTSTASAATAAPQTGTSVSSAASPSAQSGDSDGGCYVWQLCFSSPPSVPPSVPPSKPVTPPSKPGKPTKPAPPPSKPVAPPTKSSGNGGGTGGGSDNGCYTDSAGLQICPGQSTPSEQGAVAHFSSNTQPQQRAALAATGANGTGLIVGGGVFLLLVGAALRFAPKFARRQH